MKSKITIILSILFVFTVLQVTTFAQGHVVNVPDTYDGSAFGVLNRFIMADTVDGGSRRDPDAIYRLERGKIYDVNHTMIVDFTFSLVADDDDPSNPKRPPMINLGKTLDSRWVSRVFKFRGDSTDFTLKNILFQGVHYDEVILAHGAGVFELRGSNHRLVVDNCIFNGFGTGEDGVIKTKGTTNSVLIFKNNYFRNNVDIDDVGAGGWYLQTSKTAKNDSIIFQNNSFLEVGGYNFLTWEYAGYVEFTHNTMFSTTINAIWTPYLTNAKFNDNLFFNYQTVGETQYELKSGYWDKGKPRHDRSSICKLNLLPQLVIDRFGVTEADRRVEYKNNVYAWSQDLKDFWANTLDSTDVRAKNSGEIFSPLWINEFTDSMFTDDTNYPYLEEENNVEMDPGFDAQLVSDVMSKEIPFARLYRVKGWTSLDEAEVRLYNPEGAGHMYQLSWPLPETLTYTNSEALTHAQFGLPVGDLNWYPEKKKIWEDSVAVGVSNYNNTNLPDNFSLSQNYPNPFNPTTEISFTIPYSNKVELTVFNILGQKVVTLVNRELSAGSYKYKFDASNLTSGIYFYKLSTNSFSKVRKMMLLK